MSSGKSSEYREGGAPAVRPKDAATLILVRGGGTPRVLMGKRAASHKFMPNKFVFPGGRLDSGDQRVRVAGRLTEPVMQRLRGQTAARVSDNRLRGLALAAIRETFEETGLIVGHQTDKLPRTRNPAWQRYFSHGVTPPLERVDFIARAVTPTYRTRRFDTRFFMVYDDCVFSDVEAMSGASGELLDLHWLTLPEAHGLDLPVVTRWVLDLVEERMRLAPSARQAAPASYMRFINGEPVITEL